MFVMRRAVAGDRDGIEAMIRARAEWMRERGMAEGDGWAESAGPLAAQASDGPGEMWVLLDAQHVIGCTTVFDETPLWGWTDAERSDSALFIATTISAPAYRGLRLSRIMALNALDRAARQGITWVRRGTFVGRLAEYYQEQGWSPAHVTQRHGETAFLLQRRAERVPELPALMRAALV